LNQAPADCRACSATELSEFALAGHAPAWDELVRRHTHRVVVSLLARGEPLEAAEDLAQETWVRLVQQQRAGRLATLQLPGLALAQAHWLAREAGRTRARREALMAGGPPIDVGLEDSADPRPAADPERVAMGHERLEKLRHELARCPARAQGVFRAIYSERAPAHAEVARELGLSVQRVRQILCEVRARLRAAVGELEREDER
jgi:RNA polymerase sigma-70 factor (ECF subfamily)